MYLAVPDYQRIHNRNTDASTHVAHQVEQILAALPICSLLSIPMVAVESGTNTMPATPRR